MTVDASGRTVRRCVVDASAVVELLLGGDGGESVTAALQAPGPETSLHAPGLIDVEVIHVFRRHARVGAVASARAEAAVRLLDRLPIHRHLEQTLAPRIWALRDNLTACDATYVALAEAMDCPLVTCDAALASAPGHGAEIVLVS
ncbi:MAG: type II toxin-antitoxin system VapC family toxin [Longimicrobiales bacterium]